VQKATEEPTRTRVVFCTPTITKPYPAFLAAMEASVPLLDAAGLDHQTVYEIGNPYISAARATMLRKALDAKADTIVFLDHDLSWDPADLLRLIQTPGDVAAGLYRFKHEPVEYMGGIDCHGDGTPVVRDDGCIRGHRVPAGFLKVTKEAVARFMRAYPALLYGDPLAPSVDLFNHGAHDWIWYGEDYAFSRNWLAQGGEIWIVPDLNLAHHATDGTAYPGNFHQFMLAQPGGSNDPARAP
jgi:glycosyltransferase involved in cell wall biosynthesis